MTAERLSITVSEDCAQTIRELAKQNNTTVSAEIRTALTVYVRGTILNKMTDAVRDAYEARIRSLELRLKDKDEIIKSKDEVIKSKDETIEGLNLVLKLEPSILKDTL
jgi:hypothetical protein